MSELHGPRVLGEERSGRRRSLWWIIAGVVALLPLALLIPLACQALRRGSDSQGRGSRAQQTTGAQDADRGQGGGREAAGGEPKVSQCLRHAPLRAGENANVEVELDRPVASS